MRISYECVALPRGVLHMMIDDGENLVEVFSDCAPSAVVHRAASQGASEYISQVWQRATPAP